MNPYTEYSDARPKFGGAYTGWRPTERRAVTPGAVLGLILFLGLCAWAVHQW